MQAAQSYSDQRTVKKSTISQYFSTSTCVCDCGGQTQNGICTQCLQPDNRQRSAFILSEKIYQLDRNLSLCQEICRSCCGRSFENNCASLDCPILFMLNQRRRNFKETDYFRQLLVEHF